MLIRLKISFGFISLTAGIMALRYQTELRAKTVLSISRYIKRAQWGHSTRKRCPALNRIFVWGLWADCR
jgi:hypothetical protein